MPVPPQGPRHSTPRNEACTPSDRGYRSSSAQPQHRKFVQRTPGSVGCAAHFQPEGRTDPKRGRVHGGSTPVSATSERGRGLKAALEIHLSGVSRNHPDRGDLL